MKTNSYTKDSKFSCVALLSTACINVMLLCKHFQTQFLYLSQVQDYEERNKHSQ